MLVTTKAIVLSKIKYGDNDLIVKCYTQHKGVLSLIIRGVFKTKKTRAKAAYFQPLSQLNLIVVFNENRTLHTLKDVKMEVIYSTLHQHVLKSSVIMFLAEVLSSVLKEEESNHPLFSYIETTFMWLDSQNEYVNFHLLFLLNLSRYLGFYPDTEHIDFPYFSLTEGRFVLKPIGNYTIKDDNLNLLKALLGTKFDELSRIKINPVQRKLLLNMMLQYYNLHLDGFKTPKSLQVFNQVFN